MPVSFTVDGEVLLRVEGLAKHFPVDAGWWATSRGRRPVLKAVENVTLDVHRGMTLGVVGESGSGKSTLGRMMLRLIQPTAGRVLFEGRDLLRMNAAGLGQFRRRVQIIFQDPYTSLNPRMRIGQIIREPLDIYREGSAADRQRRVSELLERVGLSPMHAGVYPSELSGGQRQRVGIAAALALSPELIVADEPVSSLDVSVQAQILNLLAELQQSFGLTLVFISHDLRVVRHLCDRVAVMYLGRILEEAPTKTLFSEPQHPYTRALLSAIPVPDPRQRAETSLPEGDPPSPINPPPGCSFHPRCLHAMRICKERLPELRGVAADHNVACYLTWVDHLTAAERQPMQAS